MTIDEKDIEIAKLRGKVEALEGELAKERALRTLMQPQPPQVVPMPYPVYPPIAPLPDPIYPWYLQWPYGTWYHNANNAGCAGNPIMGATIVAETAFVPGAGNVACAPLFPHVHLS